MAVTERKVKDLIPYAKNSRTHSDDQIKQVMRSIEEFGFTNPILLHKNTVLAGHCRLEAAKRLGKDKVPCINLDHLTPDQARAYVIADNKLALNAGWDDGILRQEIEDLLKTDFDISIIGFSIDDFQRAGIDDFTPNLPDDDFEKGSSEQLILRVEFEDEESQQELFTELRDRGYKVKV